jgi:integrase/recombinase XerC
MAKVVRVNYFTKERKDKINSENTKKYEKYLRSNIIKNKDVEETTFKVYQNNFMQFFVYLSEEWNNIDLYSEEFIENAVDIMEGFMSFCQDTLKNNKKAINNKCSAVSSFYCWSVKRKLIPYHPFSGQLDRMKGASDEKIRDSYFLTEEQINQIKEAMKDEDKYSFQDRLLFDIAIDSANRVGGLQRLTISSFDADECVFTDIREKRGKMVDVAIEEETRDLVEEWLNYRKENMDGLEVDSIFITKYGGQYKPMSKGTIQEKLKQVGQIVGIPDFYAHCTRKSRINLIVEGTGDLTLAQTYANHESPDTTSKHYVKKKSKSETRKQIKEAMRIKQLEKEKLKEHDEQFEE